MSSASTSFQRFLRLALAALSLCVAGVPAGALGAPAERPSISATQAPGRAVRDVRELPLGNWSLPTVEVEAVSGEARVTRAWSARLFLLNRSLLL